MAKVHKSHLTRLIIVAERNKAKIERNTLYTSFWLRKSGAERKNSFSVIFKMTYNTKVKQYATGLICQREDFDKPTLTIKNNPVGTLLLKDLLHKANAAYAELKLTGRPIDLAVIWKLSNGQTLNTHIPNVSNCLHLFLAQIEEQHKTGEIGKSVVEKVGKWNKRTNDFLSKRYGQNATLDDILPADAKGFFLYLKSDCELSHNYAAGVVQHLKRVLNFAVENEWIVRNPLMNYRRKLQKIKGEILTESEMEAIQNFEIFAPVLDHIRHAFLFQCYTGLGYADLKRVTVSDILRDDITGEEYIKLSRQKSKETSLIPLHYEAQKIIKLFKNHPLRLQKGVLVPIVSNQKYNAYLKQLAGIMGTTKHLTTHVARRTAGTYYLNKGMQIESVSAMLGHTNTVTTQKHYTITRPERIIKDFLKNDLQTRKAQ